MSSFTRQSTNAQTNTTIDNDDNISNDEFETSNPNENYLLGNAFGLARYGVFCNSCSELAVKALQERNEW